jgi:hypothetical protein
MKKLLSMLKVIPDNVRVLHRNLVGDVWFADHKELGKIYEALDGIADDVIEIAMSLGHAEPSLAEAVSEYESIGGSAYENEQAWSMLHAMLLDLHEEIGNHEGSVPGDVWNKLEEHQYYLNKLANYKVASRLNKRAVQASAPEQGEAYSTEELQEAFTKAGYDTAKYTVKYLAEQLGFVPLSEDKKPEEKNWANDVTDLIKDKVQYGIDTTEKEKEISKASVGKLLTWLNRPKTKHELETDRMELESSERAEKEKELNKGKK